jgi:hypothetical protein
MVGWRRDRDQMKEAQIQHITSEMTSSRARINVLEILIQNYLYSVVKSSCIINIRLLRFVSSPLYGTLILIEIRSVCLQLHCLSGCVYTRRMFIEKIFMDVTKNTEIVGYNGEE